MDTLFTLVLFCFYMFVISILIGRSTSAIEHEIHNDTIPVSIEQQCKEAFFSEPELNEEESLQERLTKLSKKKLAVIAKGLTISVTSDGKRKTKYTLLSDLKELLDTNPSYADHILEMCEVF